MSDMTENVTVRRLSREPAAVLAQLADAPRGLIVTRDGVEVARLTPLSAVERAWRDAMREAGHDPDAFVGVADAPLRIDGAGLSESLAAGRADER
jgi:antitoxin (DNA-binding transcriptional repressor) of toxin-antitoxin stability system